MDILITIGTILGGAGALVAAGAAVFAARFTYRIMLAGQKQVAVSQEQLASQERPVLVPMGKPTFQQDPDNDKMLDWSAQEQPLTIRNLGTGTAFNVACVLCGPKSYIVDSPTGPQRSDNSDGKYWTRWLGAPIAPGEPNEGNLNVGGVFLDGNRHIAGYPFNAPDEPYLVRDSGKGILWRVARVTLTYHDISERKFASIFDYVHNRGWYKVAILPDITHDLYDLEGHNREIVDQSAPADVAEG